MKNIHKIKREKRGRRRIRIRARVKGTFFKPRLSVFRSNKHIFLQLIDDESGKTLLSVGDFEPKKKAKSAKKKAGKIDSAVEAGKKLAELAKGKKIKKAVFDRGGYAYHGRVKAAAEGAREGGLMF